MREPVFGVYTNQPDQPHILNRLIQIHEHLTRDFQFWPDVPKLSIIMVFALMAC